MNVLRKLVLLLLLSIVIAVPFLSTSANALSDASPVEITEWEMMWEEEPGLTILEVMEDNKSSGWVSLSADDDLPEKPSSINSAWIKFNVNELDYDRPTLLIEKLTGRDVTIYVGSERVYLSKRNYPYYKNEILLSLSKHEANATVYINVYSTSQALGLEGSIHIGENQILSKDFMKNGMLDVILGASLIFISIAMLTSSVFLNKTFIVSWLSLSFIIFSIGVMIVTYSPYLHTVYPQYGRVSYYLFDIAGSLLMPSVYLFFEKIFGRGPFGLITIIRRVQVIIGCFNISFLLLSFASELITDYYQMTTIYTFGGSAVFGNLILFIFLIKYCRQKNNEAIILTLGFGVFAFIGILEMIWYFVSNMNYDLFLWKWGILSFIASLVAILARKILQNYNQMVKYSKQLEVFNNELQRSEKMEVISQLAASIAHEVRNPLQVTRGFLQLLRDKTSNDKDKGFMILAINELDRASEIITDFLTFAKPQVEQTTLLNIAAELQQIEGILQPLAHMQGGIIKVEIDGQLFVRGNSSKFKQALINIIKNSIEAFDKEGVIVIKAYMETSKGVIICIKDNGEGISEEDLKRLGEPYYSKKSKGTGLGLMVTFRIIEVMQGKINFYSIKGNGTEVLIQLPFAE